MFYVRGVSIVNDSHTRYRLLFHANNIMCMHGNLCAVVHDIVGMRYMRWL